MHTQHAATRGQYPEHDTTLKWYGRAYTREAKPDYTQPADHIPPPFPRASVGNLWLAVLQHMVEEMPTPLVPATVLGSVHDDGLPMQELRNEIMLPSTKAEVKDAAWRYVVSQARKIRHDWTYFAIGLAMPGLRNAAMRLAPPEKKVPFSRVAFVHRRMATEFVYALGKVELDRAHIVARLIGQAVDAVREHGRAKPPPPALDLAVLDYLDPDTRAENSRQHKSSYLDALIALARLVRDTEGNKPGRILTVTDARLIAYTYIDGHTLAQAAPWVNLTEPAARMRRDRARKLIATLLDGKTGRRPLPERTEPEPAEPEPAEPERAEPERAEPEPERAD